MSQRFAEYQPNEPNRDRQGGEDIQPMGKTSATAEVLFYWSAQRRPPLSRFVCYYASYTIFPPKSPQTLCNISSQNLLTNGRFYGIILVSRGEVESNTFGELALVKSDSLIGSTIDSQIQKIFEKVFKNPLTNATKCGII